MLFSATQLLALDFKLQWVGGITVDKSQEQMKN